MRKVKVLKKDIIIHAGTIFWETASDIILHGDDQYETVIVLDDFYGHLTYQIGDNDLEDWFDTVDDEGTNGRINKFARTITFMHDDGKKDELIALVKEHG